MQCTASLPAGVLPKGSQSTVLLELLTWLLWRLLPAPPRIAAPLGRGCPPSTGLPVGHILQLNVRDHVDQGALSALVAALALCRRPD